MPTAAATTDTYRLLTHDALQTVLPQTPPNSWPDLDDRTAWDKAAQTPWGAAIKEAVLLKAERIRPNARRPASHPFRISRIFPHRRPGGVAKKPCLSGCPIGRLRACRLLHRRNGVD